MNEKTKLQKVASFNHTHYPVEICGGQKFVTVPEWFVIDAVESAINALKMQETIKKMKKKYYENVSAVKSHKSNELDCAYRELEKLREIIISMQ